MPTRWNPATCEYEELPLPIRPLMPNVHNLAGKHRGEPGPACHRGTHPAHDCPGDDDG